MPEPLVPPESQYCDANGVPMAGGTIDTFIPGTDTPKDTWSDMAGTALNTNPIVLDAAGRALIYGDGEYRFVLKDAAGNLIYDQLTTSFISDAMKDVVQAPSHAEAVRLLGIGDMIQAETDRAMAAEANLQTEITSEVNRATAAETSLRNDLNAEIARAEAAEANLQSQIDAHVVATLQSGVVLTDGSSGTGFVTFATPFTVPPAVVGTVAGGPGFTATWLEIQPTTTGFTVYTAMPLADDSLHPIATYVMWIATGY